MSKTTTEVTLEVRTGKGYINTDNNNFTDVVERVTRLATHHSRGGWWSVWYKGNRYQLFGGIRTSCFICLNHPLNPKG